MRVARELHDSVNQILSSTKFRLDSIEEKDLVPNMSTAEALTKAKGLLDKAMHEVWRISRNLRPSELDDLGLIPAVRSLCSEFMHRTGVNVALHLPRMVQLSPNIELTLYRIIQEALNNVEKHSEATDVSLTLSDTDTELRLHMEDNGIGFKSPSSNPSNPRKKSGMGLVGIMERVAYVGGFVELKSVPDRGARIEVRIPRLTPEISMRTEKTEELAIVRR
jgi:two-component system, NarL family, sensor kinase